MTASRVMIPLGLLLLLLELVLVVGAFMAIISEPYPSMNSYFIEVVRSLRQSYLLLIFFVCCIGAILIALKLLGIVRPWRSLAQVAIYLFLPILALCFCSMCDAITDNGFYMGQTPPEWAKWPGFAIFGSLWWYPIFLLVGVIWWIAGMAADVRAES